MGSKKHKSEVEKFLDRNGFVCPAIDARITKLQCEHSRVRGKIGRETKDCWHSYMCNTRCKLYKTPSKYEKKRYYELVGMRTNQKAKKKLIGQEEIYETAING